MSADLNAPTPERLRRSSYVTAPAIGTEAEPGRAGQRMYRALSTIERLLRDGHLTPRQAEAGDRLRDDYELGVEGVRNGQGNGQWGWSFPEAQLQAVKRFHLAAHALGPHVHSVVFWVCVGGVTLKTLAAHLQPRRNRQELAGILKVGLDMLADHYGM